MSNLLFMDESNGNGIYATKSNNPAITASTAAVSGTNSTQATKANNIDNIMAITTNAAAVAAATLSTSVSNEDLSQSLSEYTDADESISAPTEFLAEFLSAVMLKDYKKALKYCKLILQYEPNNATAKEFYPLILDKLHGAASSDSDENYNKSSSPELALELQSAYPSAGESDEAASDDQPEVPLSHRTEDADDFILNDENFSGEAQSLSCSGSSNGSGSGGESLSSVSMDEEEDDIDVDDDDDDDEDDDDDDDVDDVEEDDVEDALSSSGDDLPIDEANISLDNAGCSLDIASHSSRNSSSGAEGRRSRSDNTTHSYSSLLLEEEDDILAVNINLLKDKEPQDLDVSNGNKLPSTSCSDSESPTEPLTQRLAAILLSKCGVSNAGENF